MAADHASENTEERTFLLKIFSTDIYDPYLIFYFCMNPNSCLYLHQKSVSWQLLHGLHVQ